MSTIQRIILRWRRWRFDHCDWKAWWKWENCTVLGGEWRHPQADKGCQMCGGIGVMFRRYTVEQSSLVYNPQVMLSGVEAVACNFCHTSPPCNSANASSTRP